MPFDRPVAKTLAVSLICCPTHSICPILPSSSCTLALWCSRPSLHPLLSISLCPPCHPIAPSPSPPPLHLAQSHLASSPVQIAQFRHSRPISLHPLAPIGHMDGFKRFSVAFHNLKPEFFSRRVCRSRYFNGLCSHPLLSISVNRIDHTERKLKHRHDFTRGVQCMR